MNAKNKNRWILDAALFAGLIIACFVDLTGLELHQWIGVIAGAAALYHLVDHIDWVEAAGQRFFGRMAPRARTYFVIDAALLVGFFLMVGTGLVMSTWLNLALTGYAAWRTVHIGATIATLAVTALKVYMHRAWIVQTARKLIPAAQPLVTAPSPLPRREFLGVMGVVSAATVLAMGQGLKGLQNSTAEVETTASTGTTSSALATPMVETSQIATAAATQTASPTATAEATATAVEAAAADTSTSTSAASTTASAASTCSIRCGKRCSYPGHCRRYVDTNSNNRCDLGECL